MWWLVLYIYILGVAALLLYLHTSIEERFAELQSDAGKSEADRQLVAKQRELVATPNTAICFDCAEFYSGVLSQTNATTMLSYNKLQTVYIQQTLDKISEFLEKPLSVECQGSIAKCIDCMKQQVRGVRCPHTIDDPSCKTNETILDSIISKSMLCVANGSCTSTNITGFLVALRENVAKAKDRFRKCREEFEKTSGPCIDVYINAIQNKVKAGGNDSDLIITSGQLKEEINKTSSFAMQSILY